jgi:NTP pyrophosphatase (non-canonical NTP hydrolase)
MQFSEYQKECSKTAQYPIIGANFVYPTLGLVGEAGEVAEKVKKLFRDKNMLATNVVSAEDIEAIKKELGDVLWYVAQLATELGLDLDNVATYNIEKLQSRLVRGTVQGDGDNR